MAPSRLLQPTVITSLGDVYCYQPDDDIATITANGDIQPVKSHRRTFPRGLKRLRDRLRLLEERLQLDANALRQEVANLELDKSLIEAKLQRRERQLRKRAVDTVVDYLEVFQSGLLFPTVGADRYGYADSREGSRRELLVDRQRHFLTNTFDRPTAAAVVNRWTQLSYEFGALRLERFDEIKCFGCPQDPIVVASGLISVCVVLAESDGQEASSVAHRIKASYPCRVVCCFDRSGIVVSHQLDLDLLPVAGARRR